MPPNAGRSHNPLINKAFSPHPSGTQFIRFVLCPLDIVACMELYKELYKQQDSEMQAKFDVLNAEIKKQFEPQVEAWKTMYEAHWTWTEAETEIKAIKAVLESSYSSGYTPGAEDIDANIKYYEEYIATLTAENEQYTAMLAGEQATDKEFAIELQKLRITARQAMLTARQAAVDAAKAALDTLLAEEEVTE